MIRNVGTSGMIVGSRRALALSYEAKRGNNGAKETLKQETRDEKANKAEREKLKAKIARTEARLAAKIEKLEKEIARKAAAIAVLESEAK